MGGRGLESRYLVIICCCLLWLQIVLVVVKVVVFAQFVILMFLSLPVLLTKYVTVVRLCYDLLEVV